MTPQPVCNGELPPPTGPDAHHGFAEINPDFVRLGAEIANRLELPLALVQQPLELRLRDVRAKPSAEGAS